METIQNKPLNRCEEVLAHEGVKGMHWYIRRYQPYPSGYDGEGKFVGKRAARKAAKIEKRQARHQAKTNARIKNAIDTGDKKKLKKYQDEMAPDEYEKNYAETVKNGIDNAVKDRDKSALKKYKEDLNKREYKHQQNRIEFKEAVDNDKNKKVDRLLSKVDPEDVTEATNLIKSRLALQDQKLSKIRQDSELMAKMDKIASGLGKVSKIAQNASSITSSVMSVNKQLTEFSKSASDAEKKKKEKELEKIICSGDLDKIRKAEKNMTASQLDEAYNRIIQSGNEREIRKAAPYMNNKQVTEALQKLKQMDELNKRKDPDSVDIPIEDPESTPTADASRSAPVQAVRDWIDSGFAASSDRTSSSDRHRFLINQSSAATTVGEARTIVGSQMSSNVLNEGLWWNSRRDGSYTIAHSDDISYEDVLTHHGILGMKWGVRRYQNPDGTLTAAGKKRYFGEDRLPTEEGKEYIAKSAKKYAKKSKTLKELNKKRGQFERVGGTLNYYANKHASQVTKIRPEDHMRYLMSDDSEKVKKAIQYLDIARKDMDDDWKHYKMDEKQKEIKNLQRQFESETRSFVNNILGEYSDTKLSDPMAIVFDTKTKKIMQQTLADAETIRISRMYAGLWDVD